MNDQEMIKAFNDDFEFAYRELLDKYTGLVYVIVRSKLAGVCNEEAMEEFVSDVFYTFARQIEKIDLEKGTIKAYLSVIAKRKAIRRYQEIKKSPCIYSVDENQITIQLISNENLEQNMLQRERREYILDAVKGLGKPDSEIIIRKYYYGQTALEIGNQLHMSHKAVAKRAERAVRKLREQLEGSEIREALL